MSSFDFVREAAQRRGLSIRGSISACAYNAALADKREHNELFSQMKTFVVAPESGKVFAEAWDKTKPDNKKMCLAKKRTSEIRDIESDDDERF